MGPRMICRLVNNEFERTWKSSWPNFRQAYYSDIYVEGLRKQLALTSCLCCELCSTHLRFSVSFFDLCQHKAKCGKLKIIGKNTNVVLRTTVYSAYGKWHVWFTSSFHNKAVVVVAVFLAFKRRTVRAFPLS